MQKPLFRFLAVRSAERKSQPDGRIVAFGRSALDSDLYEQILAVDEGEQAGQQLAQLATQYQASSTYLKSLADLEFDVRPLLAWSLDRAASSLQDLDLPSEIQQLYGQTAQQIATADSFHRSWKRLADTLLADSVAKRRTTPRRDDYVAAIKLLSLLEAVAVDPSRLDGARTVRQWLRNAVVVLPRVESAAKTPPRSPGRLIRPEKVRPDDTLKRLSQLERARVEMMRLVSEPRDALEEQPRTALTLRDFQEPATARGATTQLLRAAPDRRQPPGRRLLRREAAASLSEDAREALRSVELDPERVSPFVALQRLDNAIAKQLPAIEAGKPQRLLKLGGVTLSAELFERAFAEMEPIPQGGGKAKAGCGFFAGLGDLLRVEQALKAYEASDIAHVENVLAGESRGREHRRTNVVEETLTQEQETETQLDRDLQSTLRDEMQSEAEKTIADEFSMEAGLKLSGSYGPTVSFSSSLDVGFSSTSEETQRESLSFAREITERVSERTRQRVRSETVRRVMEQVEETNKHAVDNSDASDGHVRGIYRWLNKVYDAQVLNYGKRMMLEFVVPEPAAYFLYGLVENPPGQMLIEKPSPPTLKQGRPLYPGALTQTLAQQFIAEYGVQGAPDHPAATFSVAHVEALEDTGQPMTLGRGSKIAIPRGYQAEAIRFNGANAQYSGGELHALLAGEVFVPMYDGGRLEATLERPYTGELAFGIYAVVQKAYIVNVDIDCLLNDEGLGKWQNDMFDAIIRRYEELKAEYEEKLAALEIQSGSKILGRNPLENRRIEQDELKKLAIAMLTNDPDPSLDAFESSEEPTLDLDAACEAGSRIRFFESAFEWRNMSYVHYPYFWGRKARWLNALHLTDPDPDFAAFLKAGATRLQVPVRPGFERAVAYFCQTGKLWNGNDAPLLEDDLYLPIVEEIAERLDGPTQATPVPADAEPWEVRVPTSLVLLQNLEEVPGIRDGLTGQPVDLGAEQA